MSSPRGKLVLLVDDSLEAREFYRTFLRRQGFRVCTASDGEQAVRRARRFLPDVIVMDLAMPGLDGIEATRQLRRDERTRAIPVVAVTGYGWRAVARVALDAGFAAWVTKPCTSGELVATVNEVLHTPKAA